LPLGAVVGFAAGISGWWYFNDGVNAVDGHLNKVGIYIRILGDVLNWLSYMEVMRPCSNDA
jgi:Co/Zn/Cd efflux system component